MNIGLFILRVTLGLSLAAHGTQKLFGWFGGPGIDGIAQFLATLGFPPGRRQAVMAGLAETGGGCFLALGLLTPFAAATVVSVMFVAVFTVHIKKGFFVHNGGYEYNIMVAVAALTLAFAGPGSISLDAWFGHYREGPFWGTAQIWDVGRTHLITTILAIPDYRLQPTGKTVIHFEERPGSHSFVVLPRRQLRRGGCLSENQGGAVRQTNQPASAVNAG